VFISLVCLFFFSFFNSINLLVTSLIIVLDWIIFFMSYNYTKIYIIVSIGTNLPLLTFPTMFIATFFKFIILIILY
jgi:hypothetical protein